MNTAANDTSHKEADLIPSFKDYLEQFKISQVWSEIEESNRINGKNTTFQDEFEKIIDRIDETDKLLNLTVKTSKPRVTDELRVGDKAGRRQFKVPGNIDMDNKYDPYHSKDRLVELMKQAIYQARERMIIMQDLRAKYNKISLYKMGFLTSKTDNACRIMSTFAHNSFKMCSLSRAYSVRNYEILDKLEAHERLLNLWFDLDLLIDLILLNHENCLRMLKQVISNRKHAWKFID